MQCRLTFLRSLASSEGLAARAAAEGGPASRPFLASLALALLCLGDSGVSLGTELCSEGPQVLTSRLTACVQVMQQLHVTPVCEFAGGTPCMLVKPESHGTPKTFSAVPVYSCPNGYHPRDQIGTMNSRAWPTMSTMSVWCPTAPLGCAAPVGCTGLSKAACCQTCLLSA